jgi:DNA sulfur modification protein DndC
MQELYLEDSRPWVVGYSGGKDSTAVVQFVFEALAELPQNALHKPVYVLSSDTLVETPVIVQFIDHNLSLMLRAAESRRLPIIPHKVAPQLHDSFWVLMIGKGYPTPRQKFRWCTDRLKIAPTNRFIRERISEYGEVVMVLGVRSLESSSRRQVLERHKVSGKILRRHSVLTNAYVYSPIEHFSTNDVWAYLLQYPSPWGGSNEDLYQLYKDSNAGECPLVVDKNSPSCGNSRFGCWVCTVVSEDKSLRGLIESGRTEFQPMADYRDWLLKIRDNEEYRQSKRMNGSVYYVGQGDTRRRGLGPFTLQARQEMLRRLLQVQKMVRVSLISDEELKLIRRIWIEHGDWSDTLPRILQEAYGKEIEWPYDERPFFSSSELAMLDTICLEEGFPPELMRKLYAVELDYYGTKNRHGIFKTLERIMRQEWISVDVM